MTKAKKLRVNPTANKVSKTTSRKNALLLLINRLQTTKKACERKVSDTEKSGAFTADGLCKDNCSKTKDYYPRGPGNM